MAFDARYALFLKEELFGENIHRVTIWLHSMIVLQQLRNHKKPKEQFVENLLQELRELQSKLGASENPGKIISRCVPASQLQSCKLWWKRILFLRGPDADWP